MRKLLSFGPAFIVLAAVLWSLDGLLRRSLYVLPPVVIVFYEHLIGFALLLPLLLPKWKQIAAIKPKVWGAFAWVTLLSSIVGTVLYTTALGRVNYIQFSVVVLLQQMQPLFVVLFARLVLKEKIETIFWPLLVVALVGAYFVSFPTLTVNVATGAGTAIAALMAVGAAFSWGSSTAFSRYALIRLPTVVATGVRFGMASVLGLAAVLVFGQQAALGSLNQSQVLTLLVIALSTGMVALFIYYYGLKRTPARVSSILELTWPLSAVVIDYVYFHKGLTLTQWIGAFILLGSIWRVSKMAKKLESSR
ncbi:MAG: DMT superfamily drug/metabolite permease [Candidatus Gottesmanbacteria bacterium GW2011_GWA2_47_9]|uniref:DMT superfamily drug/metabolite permease n=1 Tax=Candidatus Gottesmanbacteria bacterium GW2011_GWA2_47_9 TaxID=1618445 RepID=A0A0G1U2Z2_9BACT|nr:MAG: DMT superfamily drug/metabolite permease [Candidatus Gottesmanbacteria bacterium GW2011_GWA2_47_9]